MPVGEIAAKDSSSAAADEEVVLPDSAARNQLSSTATTSKIESSSSTSSQHFHHGTASFDSMIVIPAPRDLFEREMRREARVLETADVSGNTTANDERSLLGLYPLAACVSRDKVCILSLHSLTWLHAITFHENVEEVQANRDLIMVRTKKFLHWYPHLSTQSVVKFALYPDVNCFSLSERWIAYSTNTPIRSRDMDLSDYQKTLTKISQNLAQFTTSGLKYVSDSLIHHLASARESGALGGALGGSGGTRSSSTGTSSSPPGILDSSSHSTPDRHRGPTSSRSSSRSMPSPSHPNHQVLPHAGTIEIRDIRSKKTIAHFRAHKNPVCAMQFDHSGTLLVTASTRGTDLNVYRIAPSMSGKVSHKSIIHIYTLERGITSARITSISFSMNSKWVAVGSNHGTTHLFAINPHGGVVNTKTHCELVTSQMNDKARLEYQKQTKHVYCTPISRIRSEDISKGTPNEGVCVEFYSFGMGVSEGGHNSPREQLYVMCPNGMVGLFSLIPRAQSNDPNSDPALTVDVQRLDTWQLEQVRANYSVTWEDEDGHRRVELQKRLEDMLRLQRDDPVDEDDPLTGGSPRGLHNRPTQDDEDDEGEWISNLEIETYNQQERVWVSGQIRFVELTHPIARSNITDPNLEGEAINVKLVQMNTPTKPIDWDQYKLKFKPNTIVQAMDTSPLHRTPKLTDLDSSLKPLKLPPSKGTFFENRSTENVEDYFPVLQQSMMVEEGDEGVHMRGHDWLREEQDVVRDSTRDTDAVPNGNSKGSPPPRTPPPQTTNTANSRSRDFSSSTDEDIPEEVMSRTNSDSSMKYIEFNAEKSSGRSATTQNCENGNDDEDSPLRDLQDLPMDDSFAMLNFSHSSQQ